MKKTATLIMLDKPILVNEEKTEVKFFIENKNNEWYYASFLGAHITSSNPSAICKCNDCMEIPFDNWTKDPLVALSFIDNNSAVEYIVSRGWMDVSVTEHEFVKPREILAGHEGTKRLTFNLSEEDAKRIGRFDLNFLTKLSEDEIEDEIFDDTEERTKRILSLMRGIQIGLSLTPKKYTEEDMTNFLEFSENGYYPVIIKDNLGNHKINWCEKNGIKEYTKKELFEIFLKQRKPQQFKAEYTETETEINVTKIL